MQPLVLADVVPYAALIVLLLLLAAIALVRRPKLGFLGAWFFITLSPTSSVVPIPIEVGAERRMYLPLIALVTLVVVGAAELLRRLERRRAQRPAGSSPRRWQHAGAAALALVTIVLAANTMIRNGEYASPLSLYRTVAERWPTSLSHHILGSALMDAGRNQEAIAHSRAALPGAPRAHYDLGVALFNDGNLDEAIDHLQTLIAIWESPPATHPYWQPPVRSDVLEARVLLGRTFALQGRWPDAADQFERVLAMEPRHVDARRLLATALFSAGLYDRAAAHYQVYLTARADDVDALTNFGIALVAAGRNDEAVLQFDRAVALDPENGRSRRNLANALVDAKRYDEAAVHAARAVSLRSDDPAALDLLGRVLAYQGKLAEAVSAFERALEVDPGYQEAREHLAALRRSAGLPAR
jgi:tetratricopeptide (TPR) repeat protein